MAAQTDAPPRSFRPLYRQIRDLLARRIGDGTWQAGQILPSEPELALELGVSAGTVRKALDAMTAESLVVRRQGRGTFVARHDDARILFQFFRLLPDGGERRFPESELLALTSEVGAEPDAARALGIAVGEAIVALERLRSLDGATCIVERIALPAALFPGLGKLGAALPNNLYELFATQFGVTVARASERLKAVAATARDAELLGVAPGAPLLAVERVAFAIDGRAVEWRLSLCRTDGFHYLADLR